MTSFARFRPCLLLIISLTCLNLSHAQDGVAPTIAPLPPIPQDLQNVTNSITPLPSAPGSSPGSGAVPGTDPGTTTPKPAEPAPGKFAEFQSICRENSFDQVKDLPAELKQKRIDLLQKKMTSAPNEEIRYSLRLMRELIEQDEPMKAKEIADRLKEKKLDDFDAEYASAMSEYALKNLNSANKTLVKLAMEQPKNVELLTLLANVFRDLGNYYEASTIYEDLNKFTNNRYLVQLCELAVIDAFTAEAEGVCQKARTKFPNDPMPLVYLGVTYRERGNLKQAQKHFEDSLNIKKTEMAYSCLGEVMDMRKSTEKAAWFYRRAITLRPTSTRAHLGLAWLQIKEKEYARAHETFKEACKLDDKVSNEVRRAFKELSDKSIKEIRLFSELAESCGA